MIVIWTSSDPKRVGDVIAPVFRSLERIPEHRFWPVGEGYPLTTADDVVLAMGAKAVAEMQAMGLAPKNRTVDSLRGLDLWGPKGERVLVTYDPYLVTVDPAKEPEIQWDVRLAARILMTGSVEPPMGSYSYVDDLSAVIEYVEYVYGVTGEPVVLSFDLETEGLYPWYPEKRIVSSSWTVDVGIADVVYHLDAPPTPGVPLGLTAKTFEQVRWLLTTKKVKTWIGNSKFDVEWVYMRWGFWVKNLTFDPIIAASLLNENRSNSLNKLTKVYSHSGGYDDVFNAKFDKARMELVPKSDLLPYAGGDTDALYQVGHVVRSELLEDAGLARFYARWLHPTIMGMAKVETRGIPVDLGEFQKLDGELQTAISAANRKALTLLLPRVKQKYSENLKLSRDAIIRDQFFSPLGWGLKPLQLTAKTQKASTRRDHLREFRHLPGPKQMVEALEELGSAAKTKSTFVDGFLKYLRPDGRFHPTWMLFVGAMFEDANEDEAGAKTGRTSAKGPAIQTLPHHTRWAKALRRCYRLDGHLMWEADFGQGELRLTADRANDPTMIQVFRDGRDLHVMTAAGRLGVSYEEFKSWKETDPEKYEMYRFRAKAVNFGLIYRMSAAGFQKYAHHSYGVDLTMDEAVEVQEAFFSLYSRLRSWHEEEVQFARRHGYVRSPLGRIRHLPLINHPDSELRHRAERQAINAPIQGPLSDFTLRAIGRWEEEYPEEPAKVTGMTHDSTSGYTPITREGVLSVGRMAELMQEVAEKDTERIVGWKLKVPFPVDAKVGPTMGDLIPIDQMLQSL